MHRRVLLLLTILLTTALSAGETKPPLKVLVTGFGPFGGRAANGSWIAAKSLVGARPGMIVKAIEVPVVWGEPQKQLKPLCADFAPDVIISMGEGRPGFFDIETRARNSHVIAVPTKEGVTKYLKPKDVNGALPADNINDTGPAEYKSDNASEKFQEALKQRGYPIRVSTDAGQYLCEEMLYTTSHLKTQHKQIKRVIFVHLPPYETKFTQDGKEITADEKYLQTFAAALLEEVTKDLRGK